MLTPEEQIVMDCLVEAQAAYSKLESQHPSEGPEWIFHIHGLQRIIAFRSIQRSDHDHFPFIKSS